MRFTKLSCLVLICTSLIIGCTNVDNTPFVAPVPTQTPIAVTKTPIPPLPTITPTSTTIAIPTLSTEDAREKLLELLGNNGNCHLPCLWGIEPGKSTPQEAQLILSPLSGITYIFDPEPSFGPTWGYIDASYTEGDGNLMLKARISYRADNQVVNKISLDIFEEQVEVGANGDWTSRRPIYGLPTFIQRTEYYSLSHVLSEQGVPNAVKMYISRLSGYPVVAGGFELALFYPNQGIWLHYSMPLYSQGNVRWGCPANAEVEMELFPSENPQNYYTLLKQTDWQYMEGGFMPLEEATSLTINRFYEIFRNPTDQCIETPAGFWPTPEPGS